MEKSSFVLSRCRLLRNICHFNVKNAIFLDETWVNANIYKDFVWTNDTVTFNLDI